MRFFEYKALKAMGFSCEQRTLEFSALEWHELNIKLWAEGVRPPRDCYHQIVSHVERRYTLELTDSAANGMKQWSAYEAAVGADMKEKTDWSKVDTPKPLTIEALEEACNAYMIERIEQEEY